MKKYLLPTLISLAVSSYAIAQDQAAPEVTPAPIPAAEMKAPAHMQDMQTLMEQQRAEMDKRMAEQQAEMDKRIAQQQAEMDKRIAQQKAEMEQTRESINQIRQAQNPEERRRLMDEMQHRQQEMREEMWKESGMPYSMTPRRTWNAPAPQYAPRTQYRMPRYAPPMQSHRARIEERLENIENMLKKLLDSKK